MKNNNTNVLSLFSGGGFLDLGFMDQGFSINQAVELNPFFIEAYNAGLNSYVKKSKKGIYLNNGACFSEIQAPIDASKVDHQ
ncbi:MAG TPA: hypothetical protein PK637_00700, partial [Flavobacteriales bacterium]|nr:hypothetical protein [Flavobacteriales bacterium]